MPYLFGLKCSAEEGEMFIGVKVFFKVDHVHCIFIILLLFGKRCDVPLLLNKQLNKINESP